MIKTKIVLTSFFLSLALAVTPFSQTAFAQTDVQPIAQPVKKSAAKSKPKPKPKTKPTVKKPAPTETAKPAEATPPADANKLPEPAASPVASEPAIPSAEPAVVAATPAPEPVAAAAAATAAPTPAPVQENKNYEYGKKHRPLGDFLVGPFVQALGLVRPLGGGLEVKYADLVGISGGYTFLPQLSISKVKAKVTGWDARLKIYPLKGAFFLGVAYGSQTLTASATETISGITATARMSQDNTFLSPHIGWNWIWDSGFFMGVDLGVQLSMKRKTTPSTDVTNGAVLASAQYAQLIKSINDNADTIGKTPLPLLTLLKLGYFF